MICQRAVYVSAPAVVQDLRGPFAWRQKSKTTTHKIRNCVHKEHKKQRS